MRPEEKEGLNESLSRGGVTNEVNMSYDSHRQTITWVLHQTRTCVEARGEEMKGKRVKERVLNLY